MKFNYKINPIKWGLGIGDLGLGVGDLGFGPNSKLQSLITISLTPLHDFLNKF